MTKKEAIQLLLEEFPAYNNLSKSIINEAVYELGYIPRKGRPKKERITPDMMKQPSKQKRRLKLFPQTISVPLLDERKAMRELKRKLVHSGRIKSKGLRSTVRYHLYRKYPKPSGCPNCGLITPNLHLHHDHPRWSELVKQGIVMDISKHNVRWLCHACHADAHEQDGELDIAELIRRKTGINV